MEKLALKAAPRHILGKQVRFLRRQGLVPGHIFGHGIASRTIQIDAPALKKALRQAGTSRLIELQVDGDSLASSHVLVREVQRHPVSGDALHVDFYEVRMGEKIKAEVPLRLKGVPQAVATKLGLLGVGLRTLEIECLPGDIPPYVEVDISGLAEIDQAIHVKDLKVGGGITVLTAAEQAVARIEPMPVEKVEAPVEAAVPEEAAAAAEGAAPAEAEKPAQAGRGAREE